MCALLPVCICVHACVRVYAYVFVCVTVIGLKGWLVGIIYISVTLALSMHLKASYTNSALAFLVVCCFPPHLTFVVKGIPGFCCVRTFIK